MSHSDIATLIMEAVRSGWYVGTNHKEGCSSIQYKDGQWLFYEGYDSGERSEATEDSEEFHAILVEHCDMQGVGPRVEGYLGHLGLQALDREDWAEAQQRFDHALGLGFERSHTGHALLCAARGQLEDGSKRLQTIANLFTEAAWKYGYEGVFHQFLSRATDYNQPARIKAEHGYWNLLLTLDPDLPDALYWRGWSHERRTEPELARRDYTRALAILTPPHFQSLRDMVTRNLNRLDANAS